MSFVCVAAPTVLPVELATALKNLRIDGNDLDDLVTLWIKGITRKLEHEIGQCVMKQTWQGSFSNFGLQIALPHPAISVTKIEYVDLDGQPRELDAALTKIVRTLYTSTLVMRGGASWPVTDGSVGGVVMTVDCGYGDTPDKTPENIQLYILAKLVDQFDPVTKAEKGTPQSVFVDSLLDACKGYQ